MNRENEQLEKCKRDLDFTKKVIGSIEHEMKILKDHHERFIKIKKEICKEISELENEQRARLGIYG